MERLLGYKAEAVVGNAPPPGIEVGDKFGIEEASKELGTRTAALVVIDN